MGVYSNSPTKERLANHNRMKAFLKVGKAVSFPLDLPQYLSAINRTEATVSEAEAKLTLPKDQIVYAQFWFVKALPLDEVAFNHLLVGNIAKAEEIWMKKECFSSLQNRIVCHLLREDYANAISCAELLYGNEDYVGQFVTAVVGAGGNIDSASLAFDFLDALCEEVGVSKLLPVVSKKTWKKHLGEKAVKPLLDSLQDAIDVARKSKGEGANARLKAGEVLMKNTKKALTQLNGLLSASDMQYQMIADKLGLEILQCSIDYYNDSEEPDAAHKAMRLQSYAKSIVVGQMAKDRCKENADILQKIIDDLPPVEVFAEDKAIHKELRNYSQLPDEICYAVDLLNNTKPHLQAIKKKLGNNNVYYLKISTLIVRNALSNVIAEVNEAQSIFNVDKYDPDAVLTAMRGITHVKSVLGEAWKATKIMNGFDMEADYRSGNFNKNYTTLKGLCEQFGIPTSIYTTKSSTPRTTQSKTTSTPRSYSTSNSASSNGQTYSSSSSYNSLSSDADIPWGCIIMLVIIVLSLIISALSN